VFRGNVGTRCHIPEGSNFLRHGHEKLKLEGMFYSLHAEEVEKLIHDVGDKLYIHIYSLQIKHIVTRFARQRDNNKVDSPDSTREFIGFYQS
jgi:hypothetical protein